MIIGSVILLAFAVVYNALLQHYGPMFGLETTAAGMWFYIGLPIFLRACWSEYDEMIIPCIRAICDKSEKKYSHNKVRKIMLSKNTKNEIKRSKKVLTLFVILYTVFGMPFIQYFGWWSLLCHTILLVIMALYQANIANQCIAYEDKRKNKNNISKPDGTEHIRKVIENFYSKKLIGFTYNQIIGYTIGIVLGVIFVPGWFA